MQKPSPHSGLFSSDGASPHAYHGPPNLRRARTPGVESATTPLAGTLRSQSAMDVGPVSLYDYDDTTGEVVNTPRSLKACAYTGLLPIDLVRPQQADTIAEMKLAKENIADTDIIKLRHNFKLQMQQRKLKAAVEAYWNVCEEEALTPTKTVKGIDSTKVLNEEKQLRKIVETNKSRLRQQILRSQLLQKKRQREDERLERQRQMDLQSKQEMIKAMAERSKKEEEAAALRNQAREIEKAQMAAAADEARRRYEAQDEDLKMRMVERRMELEDQNLVKRENNRQRRARMKAQSDEVANMRRHGLEQKMQQFELEHQARLRQKEIEQARKRSEAEARAEKIQEAIGRANAQLQAKILMTEAKGRAVEDKLLDFATERSAKRLANLEDEMEKEAKRQETYEMAMNVQRERVNTFVKRMETNDCRQKQLDAYRSKQRGIAHELAKQKMLTKQDAVDRQKRVAAEQRGELIEKIDEKIEKITLMKLSHTEMKEQRKLHREEAERTRVKLVDVTPGPSDYVILDGDCGTNRPQWKMGLPASAAGPRVVMKNHPVPGYDNSPGPAAYLTGTVDDARHRKRAAFSFTKAERFEYSKDEPSPSRPHSRMSNFESI